MGTFSMSTVQMTGMPMTPAPTRQPVPPPVSSPAAPPPVYSQPAPPPPQPLPPPPSLPLPARAPEGSRLPNWLGALLAFAAVGLIAAGVTWYTTRSRNAAADGDDPSLSASPRKTPANAGLHPYAKDLELTGFRITDNSTRKMQLTFLVVNHGSAEMSDLAGIVTLNPKGAGPDDKPACTFKFKVSSVPPFGAKEVVVNEFMQRRKPIDMPDWQFLVPVVEITSPE